MLLSRFACHSQLGSTARPVPPGCRKQVPGRRCRSSAAKLRPPVSVLPRAACERRFPKSEQDHLRERCHALLCAAPAWERPRSRGLPVSPGHQRRTFCLRHTGVSGRGRGRGGDRRTGPRVSLLRTGRALGNTCGALRVAHGMNSFAGNRWATAWQWDRASIRNAWRPGEGSNPRPVA